MTDFTYFYISSDSCQDIFPENSAALFRVKLPRVIKLHKAYEWSLALVDIQIPKLKAEEKPDFLTLYCSVCTPTVYHSTLRPVLQRFYFHQLKFGRPIEIQNPRYMPISTQSLDTIEFKIEDSRGQRPIFRPVSLTCVLHLRGELKTVNSSI